MKDRKAGDRISPRENKDVRQKLPPDTLRLGFTSQGDPSSLEDLVTRIERRRLLSLGIVVLCISVLGFLLTEIEVRDRGYLPGMSTMTCGALIFLIILKLRRRFHPRWWYFLGLFHAAPAVVLMNDPLLSHPGMAMSFLVLILAYSGVALAIGYGSLDKATSDWFQAVGFACLIVTLLYMLDSISGHLLTPDMVLIASSLLTGLAIIGMAKDRGAV